MKDDFWSEFIQVNLIFCYLYHFIKGIILSSFSPNLQPDPKTHLRSSTYLRIEKLKRVNGAHTILNMNYFRTFSHPFLSKSK